MTAKLDLSPCRLDAASERAVRAASLLSLFSLCLFITSFITFFCLSGAALYRLKNAADFSAADIEYRARIVAAESELKEIALKNAHAAEDLDFLFGAIPAAEFLNDLSLSLSDGIALESLELTSRGALIKGFASSDASVLVFAETLAHKPTVSSVGVPAITSSGGEESLKIFSIDLKLRDIRSLLLLSDISRADETIRWDFA